ncbi:MAG: hypothetical protein RMM51_09690, partial [Verrucomicrobiae bacterium]|nr:hypothetical protein [Verrucomicrobiae bacterium]
ATSSNGRIRVFGQKDTTAGRAHLWIDCTNHTWRAVVDGRTWTPQSATITVAMGAANANYQLTWFNTSTGLAISNETRTANATGVLSFGVTNLLTDTAVKIERVLTPREQWRLNHFGTTENTGLAADFADPDADGVVNLLEYALRGDPRLPDGALLLPTGALTTPGSTRYLTLTYRQNKGATDLLFQPQAAGALTNGAWSSTGVVEIGREDAGDWWRVAARDSVPLDAAPHRFMRLKVSGP